MIVRSVPDPRDQPIRGGSEHAEVNPQVGFYVEVPLGRPGPGVGCGVWGVGWGRPIPKRVPEVQTRLAYHIIS